MTHHITGPFVGLVWGQKDSLTIVGLGSQSGKSIRRDTNQRLRHVTH